MNSPGGLKSSVGKNGFVAKWLRRSMPRSLRHHWRGVLQHTSFADSIRKKRRSDLMRRSTSMAGNSNWCLAKGEREQRRSYSLWPAQRNEPASAQDPLAVSIVSVLVTISFRIRLADGFLNLQLAVTDFRSWHPDPWQHRGQQHSRQEPKSLPSGHTTDARHRHAHLREP